MGSWWDPLKMPLFVSRKWGSGQIGAWGDMGGEAAGGAGAGPGGQPGSVLGKHWCLEQAPRRRGDVLPSSLETKVSSLN